ncbi:condensation domain-containing protein [Streptomyces sp. NPDC005423]|uniref:condensation domain-containing protein n=1 Tax=Streptomyces sp. NPDC005423 TaxID=3155343 RepID=UPI0033B3D6C0
MSVLTASWNHRHRLGQTLSDAGRGVYNPHHTVVALAADGGYDLSALEAAWRGLQLRHPVLTGGFDLPSARWTVPDRPEPTGPTVLPPPPAVCDGRPGGPVDEGALRALLTEAAAQPFDLERGPLARLLVLPLTGSRVVFQLTVEHLISDAWSLNTLLRELAVLYNAALKDDTPRLPPSAPAFTDFVSEQNQWLESTAGRAALRALADRAGDLGPVPGTRIEGFSGRRTIRYEKRGSMVGRLDAALCQALARRARASRLSRSTLTHAALHHALWRLSDGDRVATTLSTANREAAGADRMVGWLSSKVVVASEPGRAAGLDAFLAAFNAEVLTGYDLARVPWPRLIAELTPSALGHHTTEPYVTFNAQTIGMRRLLGPVEFENLATTTLPVSVGWHDASIATFWNEDLDGTRVSLHWKTDWYGERSIQRLWDTIHDTLRAWASTAPN